MPYIDVRLPKEGQNFAILVESQAAIKALMSNQVNSKLVWQCLERLNTLGSHNKVSVLWVPGIKGKVLRKRMKHGPETSLHLL